MKRNEMASTHYEVFIQFSISLVSLVGLRVFCVRAGDRLQCSLQIHWCKAQYRICRKTEA